MKLAKSIKPISYLKSNASEIIRNIASTRETMIITQNGEAKAIVQSIEEYERQQEAMSMLKILAQSSSSISKGKFKSSSQSFSDLKKRIKG